MIPAAFLPVALSAGSTPSAVFNQDWFLVAFTPVLFALALVSAALAWMGRLVPALLTTTAYGMGVGFLPAVAELLLGPGSLLRSVVFVVPIIPTVPAAWFLAAAWLDKWTQGTPKGREEGQRAATRLAAVFGAFATMEAVILLVLVRAAEAPCNGASASQTACSTAVELPTFGMCAFVIVFPAFVIPTLAALIRNRTMALVGSTSPGLPPR